MAALPPYDASTEPQSTIATGLTALDGSVTLQDIRLTDISGKAVNLKRDYAGKALLLTFWATWCPHCVEEIPSMNRALAQLDKERFAIVSVWNKDTETIMNAFRKKVPMDFPVLMDRDGQVSKAWKVYAFPSSFLIDRTGRVRYSINTGPGGWSRKKGGAVEWHRYPGRGEYGLLDVQPQNVAKPKHIEAT